MVLYAYLLYALALTLTAFLVFRVFVRRDYLWITLKEQPREKK
jgi:hypothetical protein